MRGDAVGVVLDERTVLGDADGMPTRAAAPGDAVAPEFVRMDGCAARTIGVARNWGAARKVGAGR
jgi:hypothetical protein